MTLLQDFANFAEEWLRDFTGREWLVKRVRVYLADPQAPPFLLIVGEPGIGKSAFAAYLWQRARIPHAVHFCIGGRGGTTEPLSFMQSCAEQLGESLPGFAEKLVEAQETFADRNVIVTTTQHIGSVQEGGQVTGVSVGYLEIRGLPPETAFDRLIRRPLCGLDEAGNLPATVLLIDALDEAVASTSRPHIVQILSQAQDLPPQVRFILTSRPDPNVLSHFADRPHIVIDAQSPENQEDIAQYLRERLQDDEGLQEALTKAGWDEPRFINDLGERGEWNFLYLSLILPEIAAGRLHLEEEALPAGLDGYYRYLLTTRLGLEKWGEWGADLMEVVLALQEPASLEQVAAYLGWPKRQTRQRLGQVSQVIDPTPCEEGRYWRYHRSVVDFLANAERAGEFWCDEKQGHASIADYYLNTWGGLEAGLPGMQEPEKRDLHNGYGLHLAAHLEGANRAEDLHHLLRLERQVGEGWVNTWYSIKEATKNVQGYVADVPRAWRLAEEAFSDRRSSIAIGRQCRYALITASLHSLARNLPTSLLSALVEKGLWTPIQGLAYAYQVPNSGQRTRALMGLFSYLPTSLQTEALQAALATVREIERPIEGADILVRLASYLPESLISEALSIARWIPWMFQKEALVALIYRLASFGQVKQATAAALATEDPYSRTHSLIALIPHVKGSERAKILQEALASARMIYLGAESARALAAIVPYLPDPEQRQVSQEAVCVAQAIDHVETRAQSMAMLAAHLPESELEQVLHAALTDARTIQNAETRAQALIALVPHLAENERDSVVAEVLSATRQIDNFQHWAEMLAILVPHMPTPLLRQALSITQGIRNQAHRGPSLAVLAPNFPQPERTELLKEALAAVQAIRYAETQVKTLTMLAPHFSGSLLQEAMVATRTIEWGEKRAEALVALASYLPEPECIQAIEEALSATQMIEDPWYQIRALFPLTMHLPTSRLKEVLATAQMIRATHLKAKALTALAPYLPEPERTQTLTEALAITFSVKDASECPEILADLAPNLPDNLLRKAIVAVQKIGDPSVLVRALAPLAFHLSEPERTQALKHALVIAWSIGEGMWELQSQSVIFLVPYMPPSLISDTLAIVRKLPEQRMFFERKRSPRIEALIALAYRLPEPECIQVLQEALNVARTIGEDTYLAQVLALLIPHLPESERIQAIEEALVTARGIEAKGEQAKILARLSAHLPDSKRNQILKEALAAVQMMNYGSEQAQVLAALAPHLPPDLLNEAIAVSQAIAEKGYRARALTILAPHLPALKCTQVLKEALAAAHRVDSEYERSGILIDLAPHLANLPLPTLVSIWHETFPHLAKRTRGNLLSDLEAFEPVIFALGGIEAVAETLQAIRDVGRWWP